MFRRIWLQNVMQCRKTLSLVTYPSAFLPSIAYVSQARFLNLSRNSKTSTSKHITEVKVNEIRNKPGNKIATIPNALCLFRIGMTPVIGYLIIKESYMIALALFAISGITDWLDGYIARSFWSQNSLVGSIIDPVADKLLVTTVFISLTYVKLVPLPLTILVILRDIGLIVGGAVTRYKTLEKPVTLIRYFSPSVSPLQVTPTSVSKVNTALQMCTIAGSLVSSILGFTNHLFLTHIYFATAATTIYSGFQYARLTRMKPVKKE
ncbi:CDP-alcohol phosphatidyltransferase family protein [Brugia pahangi]